MTDKDKEAQANLAKEVTGLFEGAEVTPELTEKVSTILEAKITAAVTEHKVKLDEEFETKLEEARKEDAETLEETVNKYLDYVVNQWIEENTLAVETGIRVELAETFMTGMKDLFETSNVTVPTGKEDLLKATETKLETSEAALHESILAADTLKEQVEGFERAQAIEPHYTGLTDTQKEKLNSLVEGVEFTDNEGFATKVGIIKESFLTSDDSKDDVTGDKGEKDDSPMARYMTALRA